MKSYDDLQRFKEKTQTLDIDFKDMSDQMQETAEHSQWALIRQLAAEGQPAAFDSHQRVDAPQPIRGDEFSAPASEVQPSHAPMRLAPVAAASGSILASLAGSQPAKTDSSSALFPAPRSAAQTETQLTSAAAVQAKPGRFRALFRAGKPETAAATLPKDTLLKPLLEKIALCR